MIPSKRGFQRLLTVGSLTFLILLGFLDVSYGLLHDLAAALSLSDKGEVLGCAPIQAPFSNAASMQTTINHQGALHSLRIIVLLVRRFS